MGRSEEFDKGYSIIRKNGRVINNIPTKESQDINNKIVFKDIQLLEITGAGNGRSIN